MFDFRVIPDEGEPFEVTAGSRDVLVWERTAKGRNLAKMRDELAMGDLYAIAHIAARRQGLFHGSLKEFEDSVDLSQMDDEEEPDPTRPAASADN